MSVTVGYVGSRGVHLPLHFQDVDVVPPSRATIAPNGNLQFPTTGAIQLIDPSPAFNTALGMLWNGWSIYHSLQVNVSQRFSHGISFQGAYVWSKSIDIGSSEIDGAENQNEDPNPYFFLPNYNRGVSDWDIPQHLSLNFVWDVPSPKLKAPVPRFLASGWELGGILQFRVASLSVWKSPRIRLESATPVPMRDRTTMLPVARRARSIPATRTFTST